MGGDVRFVWRRREGTAVAIVRFESKFDSFYLGLVVVDSYYLVE